MDGSTPARNFDFSASTVQAKRRKVELEEDAIKESPANETTVAIARVWNPFKKEYNGKHKVSCPCILP